jgi:hypothetical protein
VTSSTVRIRQPRLWLVLTGLPLLLLYAAGALASMTEHPVRSAWIPRTTFAIFALIVVLRALIAGSVDLTPTHLVERGLRRRSIEWSRIQDIAVQRGRLRVWSDDGAVHRLATPIPKGWLWPGNRFDAEYNQLGQWWVEHRGADWRPLPVNPWAVAADGGLAVRGNPWVTARRGWPEWFSHRRVDLPQ